MTSPNTSEVHEIATQREFDEYINSPSVINKLLLVHIELEQIPVCKTLNEALSAIKRDPEFMQQLAICRLNADYFYDLLNAQNVNAAPTVLFYHRTKVLDRVDGFNQIDLLKKIKLHINTIGVVQATEIKSENGSPIYNVENKIKQLLDSSPIILFMKGTPGSPQCGFSRQACHLLDEHKIKYDYFDILADQNVREQLKKYSNWSTYPQVIYTNLDFYKTFIFSYMLMEN
jgi:glutaredoxin-related protein